LRERVAPQAAMSNFKPGDWICQQCGNHNFAKNVQCRKCGTPAPAGAGPSGGGNVQAAMNAVFGGGGGGGMMGGGDMSNVKPGDWFCQSCGTHNFAKNAQCRSCGAPNPTGGMGGMMGCGGGMMAMAGQNANFKPGDWICQACGNHNFAKNETCRKCGNPRPEEGGPAAMQMKLLAAAGPMAKLGDWMCPSCNDLNFARNEQCRSCGFARPAEAGPQCQMKPGDFMCAACGKHNFAKYENCRNCGAPRPEGAGPQVRPGDWSCGSCGAHNFARNPSCRSCGAAKPAEGVTMGRGRSRSPHRVQGFAGL